MPIDFSFRASSISALRYVFPAPYTVIDVLAYYDFGNGGGGLFYGAPSSAPGTYVENGGTVIVPVGGDGAAAWLRRTNGVFNVKDFGAKGDYPTTDDTEAIQNAADAASAAAPFSGPAAWNFIRPKLYFPPGPGYKTSSTITCSSQVDVIMDSPIHIVGAASADLVAIHMTNPTAMGAKAPRWSEHRFMVYRVTQSDWSQADNADVGVLFDAEYMCNFEVIFASGFRQAVAGCFGYGRIRLREIRAYQYGLTLHPTFFEGSLQNFTNELYIEAGEFASLSSTNGALPRYGIRLQSVSGYGMNAVRINAPSFEQGALDTASGDFIATAQSVGGAGNLALSNTTFDVARRVKVTTSADDSARTFTLTGTDKYGAAQTEAVTGTPNASYIESSKYFASVTQVAVDAATAGNIGVGHVQDAVPILIDGRGGVITDIQISSIRREGGSKMLARALGDVRRVIIYSNSDEGIPHEFLIDDQTTRLGLVNAYVENAAKDPAWKNIFNTGLMRHRLMGVSGGSFFIKGMEFAANAGDYVNYATPQVISIGGNSVTVGVDNVISAPSTLIGATVYLGKRSIVTIRGIKRPLDDVTVYVLVYDSNGNQLSYIGANNPSGVACICYGSPYSSNPMSYNTGAYRGFYSGGNVFTNNGATEFETSFAVRSPEAHHVFVAVAPAISWGLYAQDEAYVKTLSSKFGDQFLCDGRPTAITNVIWEAGVQAINVTPSEAGSGGAKYVIKGWSTVDGTNWLENRCLTGN